MDIKDQILQIAETLLPGFIPKNAAETTLTFHFTLPPANNYKVWFQKNATGKWVFEKYAVD